MYDARIIVSSIMFAAAIVTACLAQSPLAYPLDIAVGPVTVVRGQPIRLHATITYRGAEVVEVYAPDHLDPCRYTVPAAWAHIPGSERKQYVTLGSVMSGFWPDKPLARIIDISAMYRTGDVPPGRYTVRVQAVMNQIAFFPPLWVVGQLRSRPVDVTVTVVAPGSLEVKTEINR